jgi:hypothetical protein
MALEETFVKADTRQRGDTMLFAPKPILNLLAGWHYLFSRSHRQTIRHEWKTQPTWVVAAQITSGVCSVVFPLIVVGLLLFVFISRHL